MFYCVNACTDTIVVNARDSEVLLLLVAHCNASIKCKELWMKAGTYKKSKFTLVNEIIERSGLDISGAKLLLPFHALTGSDTSIN